MNKQIKERADQLHAAVLARYALALDEQYQAAVVGRTRPTYSTFALERLGALG